jgi:hypothetical protein
MKLDKQALKTIVKECLVEILAEGIVAPDRGKSSRKKRALSEAIQARSEKSRSIEGLGVSNDTRRTRADPVRKPSYLDSIRFGDENGASEQTTRHSQAVSNVTKSITKDPLMQELLADTANTTLQEQVSAEGSGARSAVLSKPADEAAAIVRQNEPEDIFGESAKNWATLAFS